jgi:hypothetical protein
MNISETVSEEIADLVVEVNRILQLYGAEEEIIRKRVSRSNGKILEAKQEP